MSVGQLPPRRASQRPDDARLVHYDQYIDRQIRTTRRAVKAVDWATSLVLLAVGIIGYLLAAAIVEHWLLPGGFSVAGRTVLFLVLAGGCGYFVYRRLWPLCRRAINPVFAAHAIEQSSPTLKNSLINLLLFRQNRGQLPDAVYSTLEEQAAQRLTRVPIEAAVDRSLLIRVGYLLLAVVATAGLYKVLSPKDPFIAAERVLFPWSAIVPASRVTISAITPGSVTIARGEPVDISAEVIGLGEDDPVLLRYTTADGQAVDKPVEMQLSKDGLRFEGRLPDEAADNAELGVTQNLRYHIEAGDARSLDYAVNVVAAPSILVERIDYHYPKYTGFADRQVDDVGDIHAIEGTTVAIHARANDPIREAYVDFDADGRRDLKLPSSGTNARASFELSLRKDRLTPQHASYMLRFENVEGRQNRDPIKYSIAVEPDLRPEAAILSPQERSLDIGVNDTVAIEIEARDPDFALAEVHLLGQVAGRTVLDEPLLDGKHTGRFTARYQFTPSAHDLRAGDELVYWVDAKDNRTPTPGAGESEHKSLRIASPNPAQPPPNRVVENDRPQPQQDRQQQQPPRQNQPGADQQPRNEGQPSDSQPGDKGQNGQAGEQQPPDANQQNQTENRQPQDGTGQGGKNGASPAPMGTGGSEAQPNPNQRQEQPDTAADSQGNGEAGQGEQQNRQQSGDSDSADRRPGGNQSNSKAQPGRDGGPGTEPRDGKQSDVETAGRESGPHDRKPGDPSARPNDGRQDSGGKQSDSQQDTAPVSSEGDNDAEAFERIRRHLERQGELKDSDSSSSGEKSSGEREPQPKDQQHQADGQADSQTDSHEDRSAERQPETGDSAPSAADGKPAEPAGSNANRPQDGTSADGQGPGAKTRQDNLPEKENQPAGSGEQTKSPGGEQTSSKGPSGAGAEQESQGAPNSQPEMQPREGSKQSGPGDEQTDKQEPPAGARGKRESDSQGQEGGDKAGGGEEGGGQKAPHDGTGSAGQNQSADEGAGESTEKGAGDDSAQSGQDTAANRRTGQPSGETPGTGSKERGGEGQKPGGAPQSRAGHEEGGRAEQQQDKPIPADKNESPDQRSGDSPPMSAVKNGATDSHDGKESQDERGGPPAGGGGQQEPSAGQPPRSQGEVPPGDPANLEYARKQTDLVLDKLADQLKRKKVDKNLLDQLGWSEDELRRFVERWQQRNEAAQRNDAAGEGARRELDDALRSLGLHRGPLQQASAKEDTQRDLREGFRGPVPLEYQERLRAYNQGISRARQEGN